MVISAIAILIILLLIGLPVAYALALAGLVFLYFFISTTILISIPQMFFNSLNSTTLLAVPFFLMSADLILKGEISRPLIKLVDSFFGNVRGGLALAAVVAATLFGAITGSSAATIAAIGSITIPEMIRRGYNPRMAWGLAATTGGLGILIPPSIPMIIYGSITDQSVGKLFLAGVGPGILLALGIMTLTYFLCRNNPRLQTKKYTWNERLLALKEAVWALLLPVIILGGIYGGVFTPTEAAAVATVYAFVVGVFVTKGIKIREILPTLTDSAARVASILLIIAGASIFGYVLILEHIPQRIVSFITVKQVSPLMFIFLGSIVLQIMGMFLETVSIMTITMPIFYPVLITLGIDPIHYAAIFVINMELALLTPPVGINVYVASSIGKGPLYDVFRGAVPYFAVIVIVLLITVFVPSVALWLPSLIIK